MKNILNYLLILSCLVSGAQEEIYTSQDISVNSFIDGTLLMPSTTEKFPLAIIIAGSGPTDRNGNQNFLINNSLKKLAESLSSNGIASFRYDKRIVKQIKENNVDDNIMFDDFVTDAISVTNFFKSKDNFSSIYIIGHSQGSLVGMLANQTTTVDGFISISGSGNSIDEVIIDQINNMAPSLLDASKVAFNELKNGRTTTNYPQALENVLNLKTQPFIMNWMQYNPQEIIKTLQNRILVINGTKDLQVSEVEAHTLNAANEYSTLELIENMNHILFIIEGDTLENSKSYNESFRPISPELITVIIKFIQQ